VAMATTFTALEGIRAVILAGGRGTRLYPYTAVLPKPLMPIGDMPILEVLIRQLRRAGIRHITICVGHLASLLEAYFGNGERWDVAIDYSREDRPLGTAGPLALVREVSGTFLVMNGDLLTTMDYAAMQRWHVEQRALVTVGLFRKRVKIDLGIVETDGDVQITGYIEKPTLDYQVSMGIYMMEPLVLAYIPQDRPFDLPDLVRTLIADKQRVFGYRFDGQWLDIGRPEDYACAADLFEKDRGLFLPGEQ
jgi:NDP-mannose synthase